MTTRKCCSCPYKDGLLYLSHPPKYKCLITNKFRTTDSTCDCEHIIAEMVLNNLERRSNDAT